MENARGPEEVETEGGQPPGTQQKESEMTAEGGGEESAGTVEPMVARSPQARSPVTLASLLLEVRERGKAGISLDKLVAAVSKADGRDPHHSLTPTGGFMGELLVGAGMAGPPSRGCALTGTKERRLCRLPDPGSVDLKVVIGMEEHRFR